MPQISLEQAVNFIVKDSKSKYFSIEFVKRDGDYRLMTCQWGVRKYVTGEGSSYDFKEHNLICVYDIKKKGYRMIPVEGIKRIKINQVWHEVLHNGQEEHSNNSSAVLSDLQ